MKIKATAAELATLLDRAPEGVEILSLDCFDTLLWRNVNAPGDVFADLPIAGATWLRPRAEGTARRHARFAEDRHEVTIEEVYRAMRPKASDAEIAEAIGHELAAEARHCYAFAPTVALMRTAKARGLKIVIVSDTYLSEPQLRALIAAAAGDEVIGLIDRIFCSSEYGVGKALGLFPHVLDALDVTPERILHVGDNEAADQKVPTTLGLNTVHFRQFDADTNQRLRLEAAAGIFIDGAVRDTIPVYQPHRSAISLRQDNDIAWVVGHDVLGPVLHTFASWVEDEAGEIAAATGRPVKTVFLLRDGHLPQRVHAAVIGGTTGAIELSRFTARRAGFASEAAIRRYLADTSHARIEVMGRQLGLSKDEAKALAKGKTGKDGQAQFSRGVFVPATSRKIVTRAEAFADRLFAHLQTAGVERGDAVMFVDLGYNGSVQNYVADVLRERFDLHIAGRYLLLREGEMSGHDKKGLFDTRHFDVRALHAMATPIAVLEQLCTIAQGSVVDYTVKGEPVRKGAGAKGAQNEIRDRIQAACVAFAGSCQAGVHRAPASDTADSRRRMAAGSLARLLFLPTSAEVALFETFEHDVNLGTDDMVQMLDVAESAQGLRRRGLFYLNGVERMYLPGEIQPQGMPLSLALLSANRFALDLRQKDFRASSLTLPVMMADARGQAMIEVEAHATHDGYYCATIAIGAGRFAVGISFGGLCDWLQIEECTFHPVAAFGPDGDKEKAKPIDAVAIHEGMTEEAPGFFRVGADGLLLAPPPAGIGDVPHLLALTFRPIVTRDRAALRQAA